MDWKTKIDVMKNGHDIITASDAAAELVKMFDKYDWFYDAIAKGKTIEVYVHSMQRSVCDMIPDFLYGHQVKIGFASYLTCGEKYSIE